MAQGPTHLLRSCCFACSFCCSIALGARAAMFPNQSVAMRFNTVAMRFNTVTEVRMHYQLPDDVWNAFTEVCGNPRDDLKLMAILPPRIVAASLQRAVLPDGQYLSAIQASHVGLVYNLRRRIVRTSGGSRLGHMEGDVDVWRHSCTRRRRCSSKSHCCSLNTGGTKAQDDPDHRRTTANSLSRTRTRRPSGINDTSKQLVVGLQKKKSQLWSR